MKTTHRFGLTLVDVTVTVLIIGIMAAVATPKFSHFYRTEQLRAAGQRIVSDLNLIRSHAMTRSRSVSVVFDTLKDDYASDSAGPQNLDRSSQVLRTDLNQEPYWAEIVAVDFDGTSTLTFNGSGQPNTGGAVVISNGPNLFVTVTVNSVNGKASIPTRQN